VKISYPALWYQEYETACSVDGVKKALEFAAFEDLLADFPRHGDSLDIGTATGRYMRAAAELGFNAYGIDTSEHAVRASREYVKCRGVPPEHVQQMDGGAMTFEDGRFRLVTCMMSTISHSRDYPATLREAARVLAPDGVFVVSIWQPEVRYGGFLSVNSPEVNEQLHGLCREIGSLDKPLAEAGLTVDRKLDAILGDKNAYLDLLRGIPDKDARWRETVVSFERALRNEHPRPTGEIGVYLCRKAVH